MTILLLLIPLSFLLMSCAVAAFMWAVRRGQFEELDLRGLEALAPEGDTSVTAVTTKVQEQEFIEGQSL